MNEFGFTLIEHHWHALSKPPALLRAFAAWATQRHDILAVGLAGSHARGTAHPDSDIDLVILATDPAAYLSETTWAGKFGTAARQQTEDYGPLASLRVWYAGGPEVEYGWTTRAWAALPLDAGTREVMAGGFKVLFEREPLLSRALAEAAR